MYLAEYSQSAKSDLLSIERKFAQLIVKKIRYFCESEQPLKFASRLNGELNNIFRFRIGDYRVLFKEKSSGKIQILLIIKIGHRREVYRFK